MFPIHKVDRNQAEDIEYLGTKPKFWYTTREQRYLFKAEERGTGEDWAEKVVCELARLLGMPHVEYDLADEFEGRNRIRPGVICPMLPRALVLGNQLLFRRDPDYPAETDRKYGLREYTVEAVVKVIKGLEPPSPEWMKAIPAGITSALGVFIGYVMLDAWVANQDRHHQNWGAIQQAGRLRLAPTFDHGASLARNLMDEERERRLGTRDRNQTVESFAGKARSAFYATPKDRKTVLALDVFRRFSELDMAAAGIWLGKLAELSQSMVDSILAEIPSRRMSPVTRKFTLQLLMINQRRLLENHST